MSSGHGFDISAFNPFKDWGDKSGWDKFGSLSGLPVGNAIASPKWIKAHPNEAAAAALIAATIFTGGAAAGGFGAGGAGAGAAGAGAGAAAEGAASAGLLGAGAAGATEGAGLLGAGGTLAAGGLGGGVDAAAMFGPSAAGANMLSSFAPTAAPFFTGGDALGAAGTSMFGPSAEGASMLGAMTPEAGLATGSINSSTAGMWPQIQGMFRPGGPVNQGLQGMQKAQALAKAAQPTSRLQKPPERPHTAYQGGGNELAQLSALFSNPAGQEALKRFLHAQGLA